MKIEIEPAELMFLMTRGEHGSISDESRQFFEHFGAMNDVAFVAGERRGPTAPLVENRTLEQKTAELLVGYGGKPTLDDAIATAAAESEAESVDPEQVAEMTGGEVLKNGAVRIPPDPDVSLPIQMDPPATTENTTFEVVTVDPEISAKMRTPRTTAVIGEESFDTSAIDSFTATVEGVAPPPPVDMVRMVDAATGEPIEVPVNPPEGHKKMLDLIPEGTHVTVVPGKPNPAGLDKDGVPWDKRIHSDKPTLNKDGTWRKRRNLDNETYERIKAELKAVPPGPPVPPPPPAPPAIDAAMVMQRASDRGVSVQDLTAMCQMHGYDSIVLVATAGDTAVLEALYEELGNA